MNISIPWHALFGGMLLGLSATILLLFCGRVAGISGIIAGVLSPLKNETIWKVIFLIAMVFSFFLIEPLGFSLPDVSDHNLLITSFAGLLVGFGTRIGNGCTSGHGIVGMGRFSKRSIVATLTFMLSAILTVFIRRQLGVL